MAVTIANPGLLAFIALTMAEGYTKAQAGAAWVNLTGDTAPAAAGVLWDQVRASLDAVDNANLDATNGQLCAQCQQKVAVNAQGRFLHHLGLKGFNLARRDVCAGVGMRPSEVQT